MNFRKHTTQIPSQHPVRFYKIVALTFLCITIALFCIIVFMSSKRATITILTKAEPVEVAGSMNIYPDEELSDIPGVVASTSVRLEKRFAPTGTKEEVGTSTGIITIHNEATYPQPLIATTRFLTADGTLFRLKDGVTVPAQSTLDAEVYADLEGASSDIGPSTFIIPGLTEAKQKLVYGVSDAPMMGGKKIVGILSMDDIEKGKNILRDEIVQAGKAQIAQMYPEFEGVYEIANVVFQSDKEIDTEVSEFTLVADAQVVGVAYNKADAVGYVERALQARAVDDVSTIIPGEGEPALTLASYDAASGTARIDYVYTGVASISPEGAQLDKIMFFGKTKDEIRRYLLSLDHVYGVEVEFRPAWMRTVPHVEDHVTVIVKNIE